MFKGIAREEFGMVVRKYFIDGILFIPSIRNFRALLASKCTLASKMANYTIQYLQYGAIHSLLKRSENESRQNNVIPHNTIGYFTLGWWNTVQIRQTYPLIKNRKQEKTQEMSFYSYGNPQPLTKMGKANNRQSST